jgi:lipid-binding SYLF domain-containing protein
MKAEVLTYSRARGLFAGVDLAGSAISQDKDDTHLLYGKMVPFEAILSGKVPPPAGSSAFLTAVKKYSHQANDQGKLNSPATSPKAKFAQQ